MDTIYKTFFEITQDSRIKSFFYNWLKKRITKPFGKNINTKKNCFLRTDKDFYDPVHGIYTDQQQAVWDFFNHAIKNQIIEEPCGWGKSFVVLACTIVMIEFVLECKNNEKYGNIIRDLNGDKPLVIINTAPLTALSSGNQLEKDIPLLIDLMIEKGAHIEIMQVNSGDNVTKNNNNYCQKICDNYKTKKKKNRVKELFNTSVRICNEEQMLDTLNNNSSNFDVVVIYSCDKSLVKFINLPNNYIDAINFDESHFYFLNGGNKKEDGDANSIFDNRVKLWKNNPNMITRDYSATPIYVEKCLKSTWNAEMFGWTVTHTSYARMVQNGWALPIQGCILFENDEDGIELDNEKYKRLTNENKKIEYVFNACFDAKAKFHNITDNKFHCRMLAKADSKKFDHLYSFYEKLRNAFLEGKTFEEARSLFMKKKEENVIYKELAKGTIFACTTSKDGAIIISNNKEMMCDQGASEFKNVNAFVNFCKSDLRFKANYFEHDMIVFNIKQLATGLDFNILNSTIVFEEVDDADFIQFIFRSGRLNKDENKEKNIVFLPAFILDSEVIERYSHVITYNLGCEIGALRGRTIISCPGKGGEVNEEDSIYAYLREIVINSQRKFLKNEYPEKSIDNFDEYFDAVWAEYRNEMIKEYLEARKQGKLKEFKKEFVCKYGNTYQNNIDKERTYNKQR